MPAPAPSAGVPWERRNELGFLAALMGTASQSLFQPVSFFKRLDPGGPLGPPVLYAVLVSVVAYLVAAIYQLAIPGPFGAWMPVEDRAEQHLGVLALLGIFGILVPLFVPLGIFVSAAIYHGLLLLFGGPVRGYRATVRVTSYAWSSQLFAIVPFCGGLIAVVWDCVLMVIGLREVHGVSTGKAVAAVLVPFLLCAVVLLAAVVLVLAGVASAGGLR